MGFRGNDDMIQSGRRHNAELILTIVGARDDSGLLSMLSDCKAGCSDNGNKTDSAAIPLEAAHGLKDALLIQIQMSLSWKLQARLNQVGY